MSILTLIIVLIIIGVAWYLIETYIPIARPIKTVIYVIVILFLALWLLSLVGVNTGIKLHL